MKSNVKNRRGRQKEPEKFDIADYKKQLQQIACQMMRVYMILGMESRVVVYFEFLLDDMKMDVDAIMEMYESVSITSNHLLNTIKAEEEGYWEKGLY